MRENRKATVIASAIVVPALLAISFFGTAGLTRVVCWAFKWPWSWKISLGAWAALILVSGAVKSTRGKK